MLTTGIVTGSIIAGGTAALLAPQFRQLRSVDRLRTKSRRQQVVCLTFDDGPGATLTPKVLDLLRSSDVRATFYLLGFRAQAAPEVADLVVAAGHEVGAHSMWHTHAWKTTPWRSYADVEAGYRALEQWVAAGGRFRPPYGKMNLGSWLAVHRRRAAIDWWTIDSGDTWPELPQPDEVADRVVREGGGVVLLHDFDREQDQERRSRFVLETTEAVIRKARRAGLRLGTMSELNRESTSA